MTKELLGNIKGPKGDTGNGIESITKGTSSVDVNNNTITIQQYDITYTDGTVEHFEVRNGAKGEQGIQGLKGDKGDGFEIVQTYASIAAMNTDKDNIEEGKFVMIASSTEDEDNAKLYVKGPSAFSFVSDLSGAQGINGIGISQITAGTITGAQGNGATRQYTITYTNNDTSTFTVQDGYKGETGDTGNGIRSISLESTTGTAAEGQTKTYNVNYTDNTTDTFTVKDGAKGEQGIQGLKGDKGDTGDNGLTPELSLDADGNLYVEYK